MNLHISFGICIPVYASADWELVRHYWLSLGFMTLYWERPYPSSESLSYRAPEPAHWGSE